MNSLRLQLTVGMFLMLLTLSAAHAQSSGSRGGVSSDHGLTPFPLLDRETAQRYITIEGSAEVRLAPSEIRVVLAVTDEGKTAKECQDQVQETLDRLKAEWKKIGIDDTHIVVDFIAVLPRFEFNVEKQEGKDVAVEQKVGYRMQTNVHLAVDKESTAQTAIAKAFQQGVTDIIAFDYWSRELDEIKTNARQQALKVARDKSDLLLGALFEDRPAVINVQEQTRVHYPESLYQSFTNAYAESVTQSYRRDIPVIRAYRPQNTYYRGLYGNTDIQARQLPMNPEISVVSTVRLYFASPAAQHAEPEKKDAAGG